MQDGLAGSETMLWSYFWYEKLPLILGPQGFLKASRKWSEAGGRMSGIYPTFFKTLRMNAQACIE